MITLYRAVWLFVIASFTCCTLVQAQKKKKFRASSHRQATYTGRKPFGAKVYQTASIALHTLNYYGDLSPLPNRISTDLSFTRPGVALSYGEKRGPRFGWQVQFMYGRLRGSDHASANEEGESVYRYQRNASFRNSIKEISFAISVDLFANNGFYFSRPLWTPYVFAGVSLFHHNPQAKAPALDLNGEPLPEAGKWVDLQPLGTEGQYASLLPSDKNFGITPYRLIQPAVFGGYGVKIRVGAMVDLALELSMRYTFTDYLDDVSKNYVDLGIFNNELARAMSYRTNELHSPKNSHTYLGRDKKLYTVEAGYGSEHPDNVRGNRKDNDVFMVTTVKLSYVLGGGFHQAKSR